MDEEKKPEEESPLSGKKKVQKKGTWLNPLLEATLTGS